LIHFYKRKLEGKMSFRRPPDDVESMTSLRVGNIPYKTHQDDLREVFEKFGDVGDVFIPTDRESGRPRGFAFVRFVHKRDAEVSQAKVMVSKHRN